MKKHLLLLSATAILGGMLLSSYSGGPAANGQGNRTSLGSTVGCGGGGCHGGKSTSVIAAGVVISDGSASVLTSYVPGKQYTVALTGTNTAGSHPKYGFQVVCVKAGTTTSAGTFSVGATAGVGTTTAGGVTIMENKTALTGNTVSGINSYVPTFNWTAPASSTGPVKFYAVLNSANGDAQANSGDNWDTVSSAIYTVNTTGIGTASTTALQVFPNPAISDVHVQGFSGAATLQVIDASGRIVLEQHAAAGQKEAILSVANLSTGLYGLRVRTGDQTQGQLFFKQ